MKRKLLKLLALACALFLVTGMLPATVLAEASEAHIILVEWDDENDCEEIRPDSLTVSLGSEKVKVSASTGWAGTAEGAADAKWTVTAPQGYSATLKDNDGITVATLKHEVERTTITVSAVWEDMKDKNGVRPEQVQVQLLADGVPSGYPVTLKGDSWTGSWTNVLVNRKGSAVTYTVKAVETPEFYKVTNGTDTVTYTLRTGSLTIQDSVKGAPADARTGSLRIQVSGPDARMPMTITYRQFSGGTYTINDLLPGAYLVQETNAESLIPGYYIVPEDSTLQDAAYVESGKTARVKLKNTWTNVIPDREPNPDPSASYGDLIFEIFGPDDSMPMTITYNDFVGGRYTLENLKPGSYVVVERNAGTLVQYYTLQVDSVTGIAFTVAPGGSTTAALYNHYAPSLTPPPQDDLIDIPVMKVWEDNNNLDGNRPAYITVRLFADGAEIDSRRLSDANGWATTFTELPKYRLKDVEIAYSINEDPVDMYITTIVGTTITNTYQSETTSSTVRKIWNDNDNARGIRPGKIVMKLSNGFTTVATVTLSEANGWTATVNNLPTTVNGSPAIYTWTEEPIPGYTGTMTTDGTTTIFTNTPYERPPLPDNTPPTPGSPIYVFPDYETPLGVAVEINHVGDCFD